MTVGCLKITEDQVSDTDLMSNARVVFQPKRGLHILYQMQRSRYQDSDANLAKAEVAF